MQLRKERVVDLVAGMDGDLDVLLREDPALALHLLAALVPECGKETDNLLLSTLTMNPQPLHLDAEFAAGTEDGRILVNSMFTLALVVGLSVGDTITVETSVLEARRSKSRPSICIVLFEHVGRNQRGEVVCRAKRNAMMRARTEVA